MPYYEEATTALLLPSDSVQSIEYGPLYWAITWCIVLVPIFVMQVAAILLNLSPACLSKTSKKRTMSLCRVWFRRLPNREHIMKKETWADYMESAGRDEKLKRYGKGSFKSKAQ